MKKIVFPNLANNRKKYQRKSNKVLVIGGGASGTISALNLAQLNYQVYLSTEDQTLYNRIRQHKETGERSCKDSESVYTCANPCNCYATKVDDLLNEPNIQVLYQSQVKSFTGEKGSFHVELTTAQGRKALDVGAVVLALGYDTFAPVKRGEYGYGHYANVITSLELEEYARWDMKVGGKLVRPSDGKEPEKVAFIQCVGSRDCHRGADYCSSVCCMYSLKEAMFLKEQCPQLDITIFYLDMRTHGKHFEEYLVRAKEMGIKFVRTMISAIKEEPQSNNLLLQYFYGDKVVSPSFDMTVLAVGLQPSKRAHELAQLLGLELTDNGFLSVPGGGNLVSNIPGVYGVGGLIAPKTIPEVMIDVGAVTAMINADLRQPPPRKQSIKKSTMIIGGGVAGLTAAVHLADQGLPSLLIEQNSSLGGKLSDIPIKTEGFDYLEYLANLMRRVNQDHLISVYLNSDIVAIKGSTGDFTSTITVREHGNHLGKVQRMRHGALILAVGGESEPVLPKMAEHKQVVMGSHLENRLAKGMAGINHLLFIQCNTTGTIMPFCKRTCCVQTVLSAIKVKEEQPHIQVTVIYRNLRTFGLWEKVYIKARDLGVVFLQIEPDHDIKMTLEPELVLTAYDVNLRDTLTFKPDLLVVADGVKPREKLRAFAQMLDAQIDRLGFIQEAHPKWQPLETSQPGIFVCGSAVAPTLVSETILQAKAAAGLVAKALAQAGNSQEQVSSSNDNCLACITCVPSVQLELI